MFDFLLTSIQRFSRGLAEIAFPNVCICCGLETTESKRQICSFCKEKRFMDANPENKSCSSDVFLPESVLVQHALWKFDKGGLLQDLMHYLKYERMLSIGWELGRLMAFRALKHSRLKRLIAQNESILVPVPLHYLKFRKRGFNQAFVLAQGLSEVLDVPVCGIDAVVRTRNTKSQTGFSIEKRLSNIKNAFKVKKENEFARKLVIIVDDVFTTGSTTFELARTLKKAGSGDILILTTAQA